MRGKGTTASGPAYQGRITPACAGKRITVIHYRVNRWDHPRVCGEKCQSRFFCASAEGSPPRVRGKDQIALVDCRQQGITPACAGKSMLVTVGCLLRWDHPRVCGEKHYADNYDKLPTGSPPRVRGKGPRKARHTRPDGITPACAGKRMAQTRTTSMSWDHPRVCGEKDHARHDTHARTGSPPRVRGKDCLASLLLRPIGITPACAGKRRRATWNQKQSGDHPRVCGEKTKKIP